MMNKNGNLNRRQSGRNYFPVKIVLLIIFFVFLSGALSVPFYFESMTLWYKVGADKTLLRAGQLVGMTALVFFLLQIIMAVRGQFLEKIFGRSSLMRLHRINGLIILLLAVSHVVLVLVPEGLANLPIGKKYWPEMVGFVLLIITFILVISTYFRKQLQINYQVWRAVHKSLGYLVLILLLIHLVFVSDSFEQSQLRAIVIILFGTLMLWVVTTKILSRFDT